MFENSKRLMYCVIYNGEVFTSENDRCIEILERNILKYKFPCSDIFEDFLKNIPIIFITILENNVVICEQSPASKENVDISDILYMLKRNRMTPSYMYEKNFGMSYDDENLKLVNFKITGGDINKC